MGLIFDIQRFCIHDGPGIRTTVFFKGCPLRCKWCSNPESQSSKPEFMFNKDRCMGCGTCKQVCPLHTPYPSPDFRGDACLHCGRCIEACPTEALIQKGEDYSVQNLIELLLRDRTVFSSSGGGVTFSGGEPFMQADFLAEVLQACKDVSLSTCIETTLFAPWETIEGCLPFLDYIFCDVKHTDSAAHKEWTGVPCELILENIRKLADTDRNIIFRIPVIPGCNTTPEATRGFVSFFSSLPPHPIELLPYHIYGERKYALLGRRYPGTEIPSDQSRSEAECLAGSLRASGFQVTISG